MITLRKDNTANSALIETIRSEVQAHDSQSIMEAIQQAQLYRDQLLAKIRDLQADFAQVASDRDRYEGDRNQLALENDKLRREALDKETSESTSNSNSHHDDTLQRLRQLRERERQQEQHSAPPSETRILTVPESRGTNGTLMSPGQYGNTVTANENTGRSASPMRINPAHLPALALFDGTKEKWKVFKDGFLLRYEHMGDPAAKQILRELLEGKAKLEYKGLPEEYKTKSVRDCLKWLKDRCFGGLLYETMDFEKKLRNQTVRGGRVDVVCEEMEHWVSKIHTDPSKQKEVKRMQIVFLYEHTKEYRELLKLYEKKEPYSELKTHMRRVEYMDRRESAARFGNVGSRTNSKFAESNSEKSLSSGRVDKRTCYNCREVEHVRENCPSADSGDVRKAEIQCYQCGGTGHMASSCTSPGTAKGTWKHATEGQTGAQSGVASHAPVNIAEQSRSPPFTPILQSERATGTSRWNGQVGRVTYTNEMERREMNSAEVRRIQLVRNNGGDENNSVFDRLRPVDSNDGGSGKECSPRSVVVKRVGQSDASVGSVKWDGEDENQGVFDRLRPVSGNGKDEDQVGANSLRPVVDKCDEHVGSVRWDGEYESKSVLNRIRPVGGNGGDENHGGVNSPRPVVDKGDRWNTVGCDDALLNCNGVEGDVEGGGPNRLKPAKADGENECQEVHNRSQPAMVECESDVSDEENAFFKRVVPAKGIVGGLQVEACLDTGADVNLIDKSTVDRMDNVEIQRPCLLDLRDCQGKQIQMIGTIVVDVEMDVGRKCRVGFCVTQIDIPMVLLGNSGLQAMGLELMVNERRRGTKQVHRTAVGEDEVENGVVACAVSEEIDCSISRTTIGIDSLVHPDHHCKECGRRNLGKFFKKEDYQFPEEMRTSTFLTLRELAALLDLREEWGDLSTLEAHKEMRKLVDSKNVSFNSLKLAYKKALCQHALLEAVELGDHGVTIEGEEGPVSDAVTEILPCGTGRVSRKNCVVLVPGDSVLQTARGSTQEIELVEYEDEPAMRRQLQAMDHGGSFPRSIVIILKTSFSNEKLKEIRKYIEEIVKKVETTVYIATDILPSKPDELRIASIKSHQEWLTKWRIEKPATNLVIISQISGLLNNLFPFNTIFMFVQEENKNLFERGIKNIVFGTKFTFEPVKERRFATPKRSEVPRVGYQRDIKKTQPFPEKKKTYKGDQPNPSDGVCYVCGDPTHKSYFHNQPKKIRRQ